MHQQIAVSPQNLDLFSGMDLPSEIPKAASFYVVPATAPIPLKRSLNELIPAYIAMRNKIQQLEEDQASLERELFGKTLSERSKCPRLDKLGQEAIDSLVSKASVEFSTPGAKLKINSNDILERIKQTKWNDQFHEHYRKHSKDANFLKLDFDLFWKQLELLYGGDAGVTIAFQQQCAIIVKQFKLEDESNIVRKSSHVVISKFVFCEKEDYGTHKGLYKIAYSYRGDLVGLFGALRSFCDWADLPGLAQDIQHASVELCDFYSYFKPRDKTSLEGLDIVRFKEKFEFQFSHALAEKFMLFLGEFHTP